MRRHVRLDPFVLLGNLGNLGTLTTLGTLTRLGFLTTLSVLLATLGVLILPCPALAGTPPSPPVRELTERRSMNARTWLLQDGSYRLEMHPGPIHYKAMDGSWQLIEKSLAPTPKPGFAGASERNTLRAYLPQTADGWVRVEADETALAFQPIGANHGSAASVQGNRASLAGAFRHTDLSYEVLHGALKETLTLSEHGDPSSFSFRLLPEGLTPVLGEDRSVALKDGSGKTVLLIPAPFMIDADGKASNAVAVTLNSGTEGWTYTMTPDPAWLSSARFPVVLDPGVQRFNPGYTDARVTREDTGTWTTYYPGIDPTGGLGVGLLQAGNQLAVGRGTGADGLLRSWWDCIYIDQTEGGITIPSDATILNAQLHLPAGQGWSPDGSGTKSAGVRVTFSNSLGDCVTYDEEPPFAATDVDLPDMAQRMRDWLQNPSGEVHPYFWLNSDVFNSTYNPEAVVTFPISGFYIAVNYGTPQLPVNPIVLEAAGPYSLEFKVTPPAGAMGSPVLEVTDENGEPWYAFAYPEVRSCLSQPIAHEGSTYTYRITSLAANTSYNIGMGYDVGNSRQYVYGGIFTTAAERSVNAPSAIPNGDDASKSFGVASDPLPTSGESSNWLTNMPETSNIVRTQLPWEATEGITSGITYYDFGDKPDSVPGTKIVYDFVRTAVAQAGMTPMIILGYGNHLYDGPGYGSPGNPDSHIVATQDLAYPTAGMGHEVPFTYDMMAAYGRWARQAVHVYKALAEDSANTWNGSHENDQRPIQIIWEIWNEPGCDPKLYATFFNIAVAYIRSEDPDATVIAPALAGIRRDFLSGIMQPVEAKTQSSGALEQLPNPLSLCDGISVHPYRGDIPEQAETDFETLKADIDKYSPGRKIPIVSSEWGYAIGFDMGGYAIRSDVDTDVTRHGNTTEEQQAQFLVRQRLFNLSHNIPLSVWFSWKDKDPRPIRDGVYNYDGPYGMYEYFGRARPSYQAAKTLVAQLSGFKFQCLLPGNPGEQKMLFFNAKNNSWKEVAWTIDGRPHGVADFNFPNQSLIPHGWTATHETDYLGEGHDLGNVQNPTFTIDGSPRYYDISTAPGVYSTPPTWTWLTPQDIWNGGASPLRLYNWSGDVQPCNVYIGMDNGGEVEITGPSGSQNPCFVRIPATPPNNYVDLTVRLTSIPTTKNATATVSIFPPIDVGMPGFYQAIVPLQIQQAITATASNLVARNHEFEGSFYHYSASSYCTCVRLEATGGASLSDDYVFVVTDAAGSRIASHSPGPEQTSSVKTFWVEVSDTYPTPPYGYSVQVKDSTGQTVLATTDYTEYHDEAMLTFVGPTPITTENAASYRFVGRRGVNGLNATSQNFYRSPKSVPRDEDLFKYPTAEDQFRGRYDSAVEAGNITDVFENYLHLNADCPRVDGTISMDVYDGAPPYVLSNSNVKDETHPAPTKVGMWVRGIDPSRLGLPGLDRLFLSFRDSNAGFRGASSPGITWFSGYDVPVTWYGWRWITIDLKNVYAPFANLPDSTDRFPNPDLQWPLYWNQVVGVGNWGTSDLDVTGITPLVLNDSSVYPTVTDEGVSLEVSTKGIETVQINDVPVDLGCVTINIPRGFGPDGIPPVRTLYVYDLGSGGNLNPTEATQTIHHLGQSTSFTVRRLNPENRWLFRVKYVSHGYSRCVDTVCGW